MAANYITDQKGRLLTSFMTDYRGDASIGGPEILETTIDFSVVGSGTTVLNGQGIQSTLPNTGLGLAAGDSIDVGILPYNFQVQAIQLIADLNAPTPDVYPTGVTGAGATGTITALTYSLGRYNVSTLDRATAITVAGFTPAATTYANAASLVTSSAMPASSLVYTAGTDFLPWTSTNAAGTNSIVTGIQTGVYVLRLTMAAITGTATNLKSGKFRFRIAGIAYNI